MTIAPEDITGLVLAGGQGRRMGQLDKGLQLLRGYPMVMHVIARLAPQVGPILISANRNLKAYSDLGHPVVPDRFTGFAGPLAGFEAGLARLETPYLLTVPCDCPLLAADLAKRLAAALHAQKADVAMAFTAGRAQPVFSLVRAELGAGLRRFLEDGGRKVDAWTGGLKMVAVPFDDEAESFRNINTLEELRASDA
jgi:molybdopterin-guanine dinucleotide biosynthesis protein A